MELFQHSLLLSARIIKNVQKGKVRDIAVVHGAEISKQNPQLTPIEVGKSALQIADPNLYKTWEKGGFQDRGVQRQAEEFFRTGIAPDSQT